MELSTNQIINWSISQTIDDKLSKWTMINSSRDQWVGNQLITRLIN